MEINQVQLYIYAGWLGLIVVSSLLLYLYYIIRKLPNAYYYLTVLCLNFMWGFGGFAGIFTPEGCMTIGISYAAIILSERERLPGFNCQWLKERRKDYFNINAKPAGLKESGRLPFKAREKNENYASVYSSRWKRGVNISSATRSG